MFIKISKYIIVLIILLFSTVALAETFTCGSGANSCTGDATCTIANLNTCITNAAGPDVDVRAGGKEIIITIIGDTWIPE